MRGDAGHYVDKGTGYVEDFFDLRRLSVLHEVVVAEDTNQAYSVHFHGLF